MCGVPYFYYHMIYVSATRCSGRGFVLLGSLRTMIFRFRLPPSPSSVAARRNTARRRRYKLPNRNYTTPIHVMIFQLYVLCLMGARSSTV